MILLIGVSNWWVIRSTRDRVYTIVDSLPIHRVALVLGTSSKLRSGASNPYFEYRIETAAALYHAGKVSHFILSGDNRTMYYNEPMEMKKALIKRDVPDSAITLDYAGLRTFDSIVRSKEIFGQHQLTIITQPFHSYRALFISRFFGIDAIAVVAKDPNSDVPFHVFLRESFARTRAVLDLYVFNTSPRHLGEREPLPSR